MQLAVTLCLFSSGQSDAGQHFPGAVFPISNLDLFRLWKIRKQKEWSRSNVQKFQDGWTQAEICRSERVFWLNNARAAQSFARPANKCCSDIVREIRRFRRAGDMTCNVTHNYIILSSHGKKERKRAKIRNGKNGWPKSFLRRSIENREDIRHQADLQER